MSGPAPQPGDSPETLHYRHIRSMTGIGLMIAGVLLFVGIQILHAHQEAALAELAKVLAAKGIAPVAIVPPTSWMQFLYYLAIPVVMPLLIIMSGVMLFSATVAAQLKSLLPWNKGTAP